VEEKMPDPVAAWVATQFPEARFVQQGGQRQVYEVSTPERSALKIWPVSNLTQHERHVREVSALGRLRHEGLPRVVAHLSQVEIDGQLYAMYQEQWLEAPSLLSTPIPLEGKEFFALSVTSLETLLHLHEGDITHRDISLGNVLWDGSRAFIVDLGLAKHRGLDSLTATNEPLPRTKITASPEQLQGVGSDLLPSTDVYSLGMVLFIAATGQHPYVKEGEVLDDVQYVQRQMYRDLQSELPSHASFVTSMLEPVALFRPPTRTVLEGLT
jgi:serine/threonine protein kinase